MEQKFETIAEHQLAQPDVVPGRYWQRLDDERIECVLCPRRCKLKPGQRGLCFVRAATEEGMVLTTYGRSSGFCIDPIEKKPLNHFLPGTPVLSFGTAGCNLTCKFCQNWDISKSRQMDTLMDQASPEALARAALHYGCRSLAYTYNDPVIFLEYAIDTAQACREAGIKNVAVTAGYIEAEPRTEFFSHMDATNVDLKGFTERFYKQLATASLGAVKETLEYLVNETDVWVEITTLLIPGENDSEAELEALVSWVHEALGTNVPLHFSAFHPDYKMLDKPRTPHATLLKAREIALIGGLNYVYVGNVHDLIAQSSYCHGCGKTIIGRDWSQLSHWALTDDGHCRHCNTLIPGVFDGPPGNWERKRQRVKMRDFVAA